MLVGGEPTLSTHWMSVDGTAVCGAVSVDMVVDVRGGNVSSGQLGVGYPPRIQMNDGNVMSSVRAPLSITTRTLSARGYPQRSEDDTRY